MTDILGAIARGQGIRARDKQDRLRDIAIERGQFNVDNQERVLQNTEGELIRRENADFQRQQEFAFGALEKAFDAALESVPEGRRARFVQSRVASFVRAGALPQEVFDAIEESDFQNAESFSGALQAAMDAQGNSVLLQTGDQGGIRQVEGFAPPPKSGETIETRPDGSVRITRGGSTTDAGVTNSTRSSVEGEIIEFGDTLARISAVRESFRPEFHQISTRVDAALTSAKARAGQEISADERIRLSAFSTYKADASVLQSAVINQLAGAAVSKSEAERINGFLINPGTGLFDGDDPVSAEVKLIRFEEVTRRAIARRNFMLRNGINPSEDEFARIPLESMDRIINQRAGEILDELSQANPDKPAGELREQQMQQLREEFGI